MEYDALPCPPATNAALAPLHLHAPQIRAANLFRAPVLASEQYPKGLGNTVKALQPFLRYPDGYSRLPDTTASEEATVQVFEKTAFSMVGDELKAMRESGHSGIPAYDSVVLWGMETHVCVLVRAPQLPCCWQSLTDLT